MYKLLELSYSFEELEPFIDTHTMGVHFHKHYQNYLNQLNALLIKNNYDYRYDINELVYHINEFNELDRESISFFLGGVLNHELYFKSMSSNPQKPLGNLKLAIDKKYGNFENFWENIKRVGMSIRGSGYVCLVIKNNEIDIISIANQEIPTTKGYIELFNIDMWEHAYYLNYKNEKGIYLDNFKNIIDFSNANKIFNNYIK